MQRAVDELKIETAERQKAIEDLNEAKKKWEAETQTQKAEVDQLRT